jgi:hypothetical protein
VQTLRAYLCVKSSVLRMLCINSKSRHRVGAFFTYIVLENLTNKGDLQILRVSIDVVANKMRKEQLVGDLMEPVR